MNFLPHSLILTDDSFIQLVKSCCQSNRYIDDDYVDKGPARVQAKVRIFNEWLQPWLITEKVKHVWSLSLEKVFHEWDCLITKVIIDARFKNYFAKKEHTLKHNRQQHENRIDGHQDSDTPFGRHIWELQEYLFFATEVRHQCRPVFSQTTQLNGSV